MNANKILLILVFFTSSSHVLAFFGQGADVGGVGQGGCKPPVFTKFSPKNLAVVAPEAEISFMASNSTNLKTLTVTAKKKPVELVSKEVLGGFLVSGKLPSSLSGMYARIQVDGATIDGCPGSGGWLLKIEDLPSDAVANDEI